MLYSSFEVKAQLDFVSETIYYMQYIFLLLFLNQRYYFSMRFYAIHSFIYSPGEMDHFLN